MNRVNVMLHIIPSEVEPDDLETYDESRHGKVRSNTCEIKVNKVTNGFSVIYTDDVFKRLDCNILGSNIIRLFKTNVPNAIIDMGIFYHYELDDGSVEFDKTSAEKIFKLDAFLSKNSDRIFIYHHTESVTETSDYYEDLNDEDELSGRFSNLFGDSFDDSSLYDDDEDDDDSSDPFRYMERAMSRKKSKDRKQSESYGRSRVLRNAKNPKKAYRRHGVLIANDKDDIRKDEKIIKAFLRDFIPGNSSWKKDLRKDVLDRWLRTYALSKKNINRLEKEYRRANDNKRDKDKTDRALDFTRKLFNVPIDRWNDPSK